MECYLAMPSSSGKTKFHHFILEGARLTRKWGMLGGKVQETSNTYKGNNIGKANEKTPEDVAREEFDRKKKQKMKNGYREVGDINNVPTVKLDVMDLDNPPSSFTPSKPIKTISDKKLQNLIDTKRAIIQTKFNGLCHFVIIDSKKAVKIYTRKMDEHTTKYPAIVKDIERQKFPTGTMLMAEFSITGFEKHMENFNFMQRISKSNTSKGKCKPDQSKALKLQEEHSVRVVVFHIPYYNGVELWKEPYEKVFKEMCRMTEFDVTNCLFVPSHLNLGTVEEVKQYIKDREGLIEGLVVWDAADILHIGFNGVPKRQASYKVKLLWEDDVIAYDFLVRKGHDPNLIGSLLIGKLNSDGVMERMGRVGSGIKGDNLDSRNWTFPQVVEIEYQNRFPDGPYQFPVFIKQHEDKTPDEVTTIDDKIFGRKNEKAK